MSDDKNVTTDLEQPSLIEVPASMSEVSLSQKEENPQGSIESSKPKVGFSLEDMQMVPPAPERTMNKPAEEEFKKVGHQIDEVFASPPLPPRGNMQPPLLPARGKSTTEPIPETLMEWRLSENIMALKNDNKCLKDDTVSEPEQNTDIWTSLASHPQYTIKNRSKEIYDKLIIDGGIPSGSRKDVWSSITFQSLHRWDEVFRTLATKPMGSDSDESMLKSLKDDENADAGDVDPLHRVLKSYLNLDSNLKFSTELLQLVICIYKGCDRDELLTFGVLTTVLRYYNIRSYYTDEDSVTHDDNWKPTFYLFDRIFEETDFELYSHFIQEGIRSKNFYQDWILSLATCKTLHTVGLLPLLDLLLLEGPEILFSVNIAALVANKLRFMSLKFDDLLVLLKDTDELLSVFGKDAGFQIPELLQAVQGIRALNPANVVKFSEEYKEVYSSEYAMREEMSRIRQRNQELTKQVRTLERDYSSLNREHVNIANELLQNQLKIAAVKKENFGLQTRSMELNHEISRGQRELDEKNAVTVPFEIKKDLDETMDKNARVMQKNLSLQDRISQLESVVSQLTEANEKQEYVEITGDFVTQGSKLPGQVLGSGWNGLKKVFK
ncbi:Gyl1p KNAG_0F01620 [Huiozyma naganishii CBS 8797]|uniref:Rab-GAP TBC domain-containing protein n=1 Tax=Huiozyma naganishii (strain ATCC MYA-139 / BCRC 22969 / CBS 8797 / KCTC 17520 / NBRC 10181 / NCYC 3082 / Yp74L-3) TaxID=1071383 RepID=J7R7I2_HUIN7|nr:hypothetical protein KNAG_0F01620 [Kazachstania naganishii CBS 8797]CCK70830.1 hypothetical protein KNAG_0F01620 [Kazachstania naganishii CBS 8797]